MSSMQCAGRRAIVLALWLAPAGMAAQPAAAQQGSPPVTGTIAITYLTLADARHQPSTVLEAPPADETVAGARLALQDNLTTGRFLGQSFTLTEVRAMDRNALDAAVSAALAQGRRLFVADLPAALLLETADRVAPQGGLVMDAASTDDALRGADCRSDVMHTLPSRAMLADGLMQYLAVKDWRRIMLLVGRDPPDRLYADAIAHAAAKFEVTVKSQVPWTFNASAQQADTGHYQVNAEVAKATRGPTYDVLVVADEAGNFGNDVPYRTDAARPVMGTQGLVASAWARPMDEFGSTQLQDRFYRTNHRWMTDRDYGGWLAVRALGEAATRSGRTDPAAIEAFLKSPDFHVSGYKGPELSFRPWDWQLRQPVILADAASIVSISPQAGFLHQVDDLDSLGVDRPETACHFR